MPFSHFRALSLTAVLLLPVAAFGQTAIPSSSDPARLPQRFEEPVRPTRATPLVVAPDVEGRAPKGADKMRFHLRSVTVQGASVYDQETLATLWADMLGREVRVDEVFALAAKLTSRYRADGYILSQVVVPQQKIEGGRIVLRAVEGHLADVQYEGGDNLPSYLRDEQKARLLAARPLSSAVLERALLLFRAVPGVTAESVLQAATGPQAATGAAVLTIKIGRKAYDMSASIDNRGSAAIGPIQTNAGFGENGALGLGERIGARVIATPQREMRAVQADADFAVGTDGTRFRSAVYSGLSWPGGRSSTYLMKGFTTTTSFSLSHPFILERDHSLWLESTFATSNTRTDLQGKFNAFDAVRSVRVAVRLNTLDPLGGTWNNALEVSKGLDALGASEAGAKGRGRVAARFDYTKATLDLSREQVITGPYSFNIAATGQFSHDALPSAEQFGVGGSRFGRAFDPSAVLGDRGMASAFELRYTDAPGIEGLSAWQFYAFTTGGRIYIEQPVSGQIAMRTLADFGVGARIWGSQGVAGTAEIAKPMTARPDAVAGDTSRHMRFSFSLRWEL